MNFLVIKISRLSRNWKASATTRQTVKCPTRTTHLSYNLWCNVRSVKLLFCKAPTFDGIDSSVRVWLSEILASLPCGVEHGVWKSSVQNQDSENVRNTTPKKHH